MYYDTFNQQWLNPEKWLIGDPCGPISLECVREIQNGRLRLAGRIFGAGDSDSGQQGTDGALFFANPSTINSITTDITLTRYSGTACSTNADGWTQTVVDVGGTFFNSGSNEYSGDVSDGIALVVDTNSPRTIRVLNGVDGPGLGVWTEMGSYPIGTPLTATIAWDKANRRFISEVHATGDAGSGKTVEVPYSVSDANPPVWLQKNLSASLYSANCTSGRTFSAVEAFFDNVMINVPPPPAQ